MQQSECSKYNNTSNGDPQKETTMERPQTPKNGASPSKIKDSEGNGDESDV